ncbi:hypothetical protein HDU67_009340, partial [Dinochytrium kinnereticum]
MGEKAGYVPDGGAISPAIRSDVEARMEKTEYDDNALSPILEGGYGKMGSRRGGEGDEVRPEAGPLPIKLPIAALV